MSSCSITVEAEKALFLQQQSPNSDKEGEGKEPRYELVYCI